MAAVGVFVFGASWGSSSARHIAASFDRYAATTVVATGNGGDCEELDPPESVSAAHIVSAGVIANLGTVEVRHPAMAWSRSVSVDLRVASPAGIRAMGLEFEAGREFSISEQALGIPVAMIGVVASEEFEQRVMPANVILMNGQAFRVVGIVQNAQRLSDAVFDVIIPLTTAERYWSGQVTQPYVLAAVETGTAETVAAALPALLSANRPSCVSAVFPAEARLLRQEVVTQINTLIGVTAFSLLIASGVSIGTNALASVIQRRREFGLRRAMGATPARIARLVIGECAVIGLVASLFGLLVGLAVFLIATSISGIPPAIPMKEIVLAPFIAVAVSVVAGSAPAIRASRTDPLVALRS
ncbi:MAG: ABC transporter permease [Acidimicrobiia bacterium]